MTEREIQESQNQEDSALTSTPEEITPKTGDHQEGGEPVSQPVSIDEDSTDAEHVSHVNLTMDLPPGTRLRVTVETLPCSGNEDGEDPTVVSQTIISDGEPISITIPPITTAARTTAQITQTTASKTAPFGLWPRLQATLRSWPYSLQMTLFGLALLVYLSTRLIGLLDFPIYFFTDEAAQTVLAADLVRDNFKNEDKTFLPTYFKNGGQYNLSLSVYVQVLPYLLFGKSAFITRLVSVLITLLAALSIGFMLRDIFKIPYWWSGVLLLSVAPAWFLHSRTAFETAIFVSLYAATLYAYLLYRYRSPKYLYVTLILAALAFYTYSPGQAVIAVSGLLLLISDIRYHWENRRIALKGIGLIVLLAVPYIRFRLTLPDAPVDHLRRLGSYWIQSIPFQEKLKQYWTEYSYGLSPGYWFIPNDRDLPRHIMKGYGHLLRATLPLAAIGLILAIIKFRSSAYRTLLIALLAAPTGAALAEIGVTRTLVFVIPATLLTAIGLSKVLTWIEKIKLPRQALSIGLFVLLTLINFAILRDTLANGATWYRDYGLGGMQYGASMVFDKIEETLDKFPQEKIILSPSWANGTDMLARFYLADPLPIELGSMEGYLFERLPLNDGMLFIMTPDEYEKAASSGKFSMIRVEDTLPYPNGETGFYFARLRYAENLDEILAAERDARRQLIPGEVSMDGQTLQVQYPHLDMGEIVHAFDSDPYTLIRTLEANPLVLKLDLPQPRTLNGLTARVGGTPTRLTVRVYQKAASADSEPVEYSVSAGDWPEPRDLSIDFEQQMVVNHLEIAVENSRDQEPAHVHLWEVWLH
jgi:hypothetical protein